MMSAQISFAQISFAQISFDRSANLWESFGID
jgi:hypothetical protein